MNHQHNKSRIGTIGKGVSSDETNPNKHLLVFNSSALLDFSSCNRFVDWIMCLVIFLPTWEQAIAMGFVLQFFSLFLCFFCNFSVTISLQIVSSIICSLLGATNSDHLKRHSAVCRCIATQQWTERPMGTVLLLLPEEKKHHLEL